jgi:hypothetical protein
VIDLYVCGFLCNLEALLPSAKAWHNEDEAASCLVAEISKLSTMYLTITWRSKTIQSLVPT